MSTATEPQQLDGVAPAPPKPDDDAGGWLTDKAGRQYVKAERRRGIVMRQGDESVADALARDAQPPGDRRPKSKSRKKPTTPAPPSKPDLKELEKPIAEALKQPALICAMFGDEWAAEHFTRMAPNVARNLVRTAEHNEWLKRRLEAFAATGELPMQLIAFLGLGGSLVLYTVPPIVYWLNLPVPDQARTMLDIPPRRVAPVEPFPGPAEEPDAAHPEAT